MISHFDHNLSDAHWLIYEQGWEPEKQQVSESQFTLGNGYVCSRAVLEEIPKGAMPGTFFAGIYDNTGAQVTELINVPNPINIKLVSRGEKLDVTTMDVVGHKRILDMRNGLLARKTTYSNSRKKRFDYQSLRFFSAYNRHIAAMRVYITPMDESTTIVVDSSVDTAVTNKGLITEGNKRHVHLNDVSKSRNIDYLCAKTLEKEILIAYASKVKITRSNKSYYAPRRTFSIRLKKGETVCITKYFSFYTSREVSPAGIKNRTIKTLRKAVLNGFSGLLKEHSKSWTRKWKSSDIEIKGAPEVQRALRFNIYHLMIAGNEVDDDVSIGAKALTGEGYRGHVFWDTEVFILPFFIFTRPMTARNLLMYRYYRLDAARRIAAGKKMQGAMFPWESADTGDEVTPSWYKDSEGVIRNVHTGMQEHHISSDIAYGVNHYFTATGDNEFMLKYGLEIMLETARFWASRVEYNSGKGKYEIKHVIGPDEFHDDINNNAFTNIMAKWNMENAFKLFNLILKKYPAKVKNILKRIHMPHKETNKWQRIARKMYIPGLKASGIIEQFDGFFKLKKVAALEYDSNNIPVFPKKLSTSNIAKTQYVKQADVIMLLYLLPGIYSPELRKKNYYFYEKKAMHKSSLSVSVHAAMGAEVGDKNKAYRYFLTSVYADMKDIYGNTADGIHAASLGGTWSSVVNGFAGLKIKKGMLSLTPKLPSEWKEINFNIKWKAYDVKIRIDEYKITISFKSRNKKDYLPVIIYETQKQLAANRVHVFYRKKIKNKLMDFREDY